MKNTIRMCKPTIMKVKEIDDNLFDNFSRNAKFYKGIYYIEVGEVYLEAKNPRDLFEKFKNAKCAI